VVEEGARARLETRRRCTLDRVKTRIQCPCGEVVVGKDEDELVELTNKHLSEQHDGRTYDRDMILMMAT
jgi:hypothetical protein